MRTGPQNEFVPAGTVLRVSRSGEMVSLAPGQIDASSGADVYDSRRKAIGKVSALIGREAMPYVITRPGKGVDARRFIGTSIYLMKGDRICRSKR